MVELKKMTLRLGPIIYLKQVGLRYESVIDIKKQIICNLIFLKGNLNDERKAHLHQNIISIWDAYFLPADTNHDGSVEYLELLDHMKAVS